MKFFSCILLLALLVSPAPAEGIADVLGRWDQQQGGNGFLRLTVYSTFRWQTPSGQTVEGQYRLLDGDAIEFTFPVAGMIRTVEFKYAVESDTLRLRIANRWTVYKRVP